MEEAGPDRLRRFLLALARGGDLSEAAREAGLERGQAEILLSLLLSEGYIKEIPGPEEAPSCPCERCPLKPLCGGRRGLGFYVLTERGRSLLRQLAGRARSGVKGP